ncbi:DivIVA domain-containing protein [Prauserella marina]|uniref:DivIVA domain-containing protein n=1 Tax=Prauserella marina TaxID=530584 RepID=A0A1G6YKK2_9PSEU|nr:DivIVA domain-containing protein [Prauserella marina]SDD90929.1 DivIVA domain-containing protein [Prauserella marina]
MGVTTALIYLVVMLLVAAVVFLLAAVVFGRGEQLAPLAPGSSPTRLPAEEITGEDVSGVKYQLVLRGYKMSEVDWVMSRLGAEIDTLRATVADLREQVNRQAEHEAKHRAGTRGEVNGS